MKKVYIGLGSLLLLVAVIVLAVHANDLRTDTKSSTEISKDDCCPGTTNCDPEMCKDMKGEPQCDDKTNCDPASCPHHANKASKETKTCDPVGCQGHCPGE